MTSTYLLLFTAILDIVHSQEEVYSCGGFITSSVPINYASVMVKLYTTTGHLKYETECAPNNGYYMIPVYSKGSYRLKVEPPPGWEFEPETIDLTIDGTNDACTTGKDLNFKFKGFSVVGQLCGGLDCKLKPENVDVGLFKQISDSQPVLKSKTNKGGRYTFRGVPSGSYVVKLLNSELCTPEDQIIKVTVSETAFSVSSDLIIDAFTVQGMIVNKGQPVAGAVVQLFGSIVPKIAPKECDTKYAAKLSKEGFIYICSTPSDKDGRYKFFCLKPGHYTIFAFYDVNGIKFDIKPAEINFDVVDSSMELQEKFQVDGFSLHGRVLWSKNGKPLQGAKIKFDDQNLQIATDASGIYKATKIESGMHKISASVENVEFEPLSVKLDMTNHKIPDMFPSKLNLCGKINVDSENKKILKQRKLLLTNQDKKTAVLSITTDQKGKFCKMVEIGRYILEPQILNEEKQIGFSLVPRSLDVDLTQAPKLDANFEQFKAKISGVVKCIGKCHKLKLNLYRDSQTTAPIDTIDLHRSDDEAKFNFDGLSNSKYTIEIGSEAYCWKTKSLEVAVENSNVESLKFEQNGFAVTVISTHKLSLVYKLNSNNLLSGQVDLTKGVNHFCLPAPGEYTFKLESCHSFERFSNNQVIFDTSKSDNKITLDAVKHLVNGVIVASEIIDSVFMDVRNLDSDADDPVVTLGPLTLAAEGKQQGELEGQKEKRTVFTYPFEYWARKQESLSFAPTSPSHLFNPAILKINVHDDCLQGLLFKAQRGKFLEIIIQPPLGGVSVTLASKSDSALHFNNWTDNNGHCSMGPLRSFDDLIIHAEKSGYILTEIEGQFGHFNAFKLSELTLKAIDNDKNALSGVLLSLSGRNYRSNNITGDNGAITFVGLSPGEYFVKPILKEYSFDPPTQIVKIEEGSTLAVELFGRRVAFSCTGMVRHLAGQPVPNVEVEAFPKKGCQVPQAAHEEATTTEDGIFKIRGLLPGCPYTLQVKPGQTNIPNTIPSLYTVEVVDGDLADKDLIMKPEFTTMDIAGRVEGDRSLFQYIKVALYKEDNLDTPLHTISLHSTAFFFFPPLPLDDKMYIVRLESTLPNSKYAKVEQSDVIVKANKTFRFVNLNFSSKKKFDESESIRGGYIAVPLTVLLMLLAYNYEKVLPSAQAGCHSLVSVAMKYYANLQTSTKNRLRLDTNSDGMGDLDFNDDLLTGPGKKKLKLRKT